MNFAAADQIAKAVLYEGYMLYPYRPSSIKNQQRFNFGVVYPVFGVRESETGYPSTMRSECLVLGDAGTEVEVRLRFLHLQTRAVESGYVDPPNPAIGGWQDAREREIRLPLSVSQLCREPMLHRFEFQAEDGDVPGRTPAEPRVSTRCKLIRGTLEICVSSGGEGLFKLTIRVQNDMQMTVLPEPRDEALLYAFVSSHLVLGVEGGEFVSLFDPGPRFEDAAAQCQNSGAWPVLVGDPAKRDTLLISPIILYDYPQIAPESVGDLFDGTEIDEILSLRILTLSDDEKREIRDSDERAREVLERVETMPAEQFMKLHGAIRGLRPLREEGR